MYCVKEAFREAGYEIETLASVPRQSLPEICAILGVKITGYLETTEEHFNQVIVDKIKREINIIPNDTPVIVIYTVGGVQGHAEYFESLYDVPSEKINGTVIHGL